MPWLKNTTRCHQSFRLTTDITGTSITRLPHALQTYTTILWWFLLTFQTQIFCCVFHNKGWKRSNGRGRHLFSECCWSTFRKLYIENFFFLLLSLLLCIKAESLFLVNLLLCTFKRKKKTCNHAHHLGVTDPSSTYFLFCQSETTSSEAHPGRVINHARRRCMVISLLVCSLSQSTCSLQAHELIGSLYRYSLP